MNPVPDRPASGLDSGFLLSRLARLPTPRKYWVGFSGGADSTALLQALYEARDHLPAEVQAVHFHHGLQAAAGAWQAHCRAYCERRGIAFRSERLEIDRAGGASPEEAARDSRYRAVGRLLGRDEMYLTAHHAEDLGETLFLNLMRGCGIEGLAGIPPLRRLDPGWVARPLLGLHHADLVGFLEARGIRWLTDPSNTDTRFDRNYLRQELFPLLERRWPGLVRRLARSARNARVSANAMSNFIEAHAGHLLGDALKMPVAPLLALDRAMQSLVLRQWLRRHEVPTLPERRLHEFLGQLGAAENASQAEVQWNDWLLKRYRSELWLQRRLPYAACARCAWRDGMTLALDPDAGRLALAGEPTAIPEGWRVRARRAGDRIRSRTGGSSHRIKDFFQAAAIPPWLRSCIPVLEWDGEPVALGDWVIAPRLQDWLDAHGLKYRWEPADPVLERIHQDCQHSERLP
jgi:tRNA(Ile)-lysidine synthase